MAESGTLFDDFGKYGTFKVEGNKYVVYGVFAMVTIFIAYFVIVYKPPKGFEKGKTIRWVVTGDEGTSGSGAKYSYDGFNYITTEGQYMDFPLASAYGKAYNNDNFFWIAGGSPDATGLSLPSMVNSYNGYMWISNENPLRNTVGLEYGLSGNGEPLWLATGVTKNENKNNIVYSRDGLEWEHSKGLCFSITGMAVAYGKKLDTYDHMYVAGGDDEVNGGNYNLLYSYEGLCWQVSSGYSFSGTLTQCLGVAYGLSSNKVTKIWVSIGSKYDINDRCILYSLDGISWNPSTGEDFDFNGLRAFGTDVAFGLDDLGDPIWVAVGISYPSILYSRDGQSWNKASGTSFGGNGFGSGVAYGKDENDDSLWIATGNDGSGTNKNEILYSIDGIEWKSTEDAGFNLSMGESVASNVLKYGVEPFI